MPAALDGGDGWEEPATATPALGVFLCLPMSCSGCRRLLESFSIISLHLPAWSSPKLNACDCAATPALGVSLCLLMSWSGCRPLLASFLIICLQLPVSSSPNLNACDCAATPAVGVCMSFCVWSCPGRPLWVSGVRQLTESSSLNHMHAPPSAEQPSSSMHVFSAGPVHEVKQHVLTLLVPACRGPAGCHVWHLGGAQLWQVHPGQSPSRPEGAPDLAQLCLSMHQRKRLQRHDL